MSSSILQSLKMGDKEKVVLLFFMKLQSMFFLCLVLTSYAESSYHIYTKNQDHLSESRFKSSIVFTYCF